MRILLDTHCWLWWTAEPQRLGPLARSIFTDPGNDLLFSTASLWEVSIKYGLGKLSLPQSPDIFVLEQLRIDGISVLQIEPENALSAWSLPLHHKDPFDRMLIVQAQHEQLPIMTADPIFSQYEVQLIAAGD